ncbi:MAG: TlpA family protein disulfide reductase [Akkermansiaceae bacterium]|nr:TlpA family protein disulfide reductase [Akkermansiaceae bacterium]
MKKSLRIFTMVLGLAVLGSFSASAQGFGVSSGGDGAGISMDGGDSSAPKKKKKKSKNSKKKDDSKKTSAVGKALGKLKTFNGKPSKKAKVYVYLQSASWCQPCNQEMPEVAATYLEMKKDGRAELILIGHDQEEDAAKKFLKQYKAKFPGILVSGKNVDKLPGFTMAQGIPNAIMVDEDGNVLASGYPSSVLPGWKAAVEPAADASADPAPTLPRELAE